MKCKIRIKTPIFAPISEELYLVDFKPGGIFFITEFGEELKREEFEVIEEMDTILKKIRTSKAFGKYTETHVKIFYIHMQIIKNNE